MPYPAFPTLGFEPYGPITEGSSKRALPAVLTANFGSRYSQRSGDGINALPRDVMFRSIPLEHADLEILDTFLRGRKGYLPFSYRAPYEATARQFICEEWSINFDTSTHSTLSATFKENFDP